MNLRRRLDSLEKELTGSELIVLHMPDGRAETLRCSVLDLFTRAIRGDRTPEVELIARSISSTEPDGAHMIDLARALLNGPNVDVGRNESCGETR
jgi:hypothetical protein